MLKKGDKIIFINYGDSVPKLKEDFKLEKEYVVFHQINHWIGVKTELGQTIYFSLLKDHSHYIWSFFTNKKGLRKKKLGEIGESR
jgi:hypothetical protein